MMVPISTDPISFPNANGMLFTSSPAFSTKKDASIALVLFLRKRDASYVMFQWDRNVSIAVVMEAEVEEKHQFSIK